jgi:hypothetical protein
VSADVSIPRFRTAVRVRRWVLLFEGKVISPLTETVYVYIHIYPHIPRIQKLVRLAIECGISQSTKRIDEYKI